MLTSDWERMYHQDNWTQRFFKLMISMIVGKSVVSAWLINDSSVANSRGSEYGQIQHIAPLPGAMIAVAPIELTILPDFHRRTYRRVRSVRFWRTWCWCLGKKFWSIPIPMLLCWFVVICLVNNHVLCRFLVTVYLCVLLHQCLCLRSISLSVCLPIALVCTHGWANKHFLTWPRPCQCTWFMVLCCFYAQGTNSQTCPAIPSIPTPCICQRCIWPLTRTQWALYSIVVAYHQSSSVHRLSSHPISGSAN